jgi:hypothetical protein
MEGREGKEEKKPQNVSFNSTQKEVHLSKHENSGRAVKNVLTSPNFLL